MIHDDRCLDCGGFIDDDRHFFCEVNSRFVHQPCDDNGHEGCDQ